MVSVRLVAVVFTLLVAGHVSAAIRPAQDCLSTEPGPGVNTETSCFSINYGHRVRTFRIYAKLRASEPAPLVVVLHGDGANGSTMEWLTRHGFNRIADREGAIIVYPDGTGGIWNADA